MGYVVGIGLIEWTQKRTQCILYGVPLEQESLLLYGNWILLFLPVFLELGYYIKGKTEQSVMTLPRYGSYRKWWKEIFLFQMLLCAAYTMGLVLVFIISEGKLSYRLCLAGLLFFVHVLFLKDIFLMIFQKTKDMILAVLCTLLGECVPIFFPFVRGRLFPWYWGMWCYSDRGMQNGFYVSIVLVVQLIVSMSIFFYFIRNRKS